MSKLWVCLGCLIMLLEAKNGHEVKSAGAVVWFQAAKEME